MKKLIAIAAVILLPLFIYAQFEQKMSFSLSAGMFKTFGEKTFIPDWATGPEDFEVFQMSNYDPGICLNGALQFNINRHLSLGIDVEYMHAGSWYYDAHDGSNFLYYAVYDSLGDEILDEGENNLTLTNISLGLVPRYYFYPWNKFSIFLFTGLSINFTSAIFENNEWEANQRLGTLDPEDTEPYEPYLKKHTGLGLISGFGAEYDLNDKLGFFISAGYHLAFLNEKNFEIPDRKENLNAFSFQAGIRLSFLKSKEL